MKTLFFTCDWVQDNNDNYKLLEINTNSEININIKTIDADIDLEKDLEYKEERNRNGQNEMFWRNRSIDNFKSYYGNFFDIDFIISFLDNNNITNITLIHSFEGLLSDFFKDMSVVYDRFTYNSILTDKFLNTVPDIEDSDDTLIVRHSYDQYSLVDSLYAGDGFGLFELLKDTDLTPKSYFVNGDGDLTDTFGDDYTFNVNGGVPNIIVKSRYPDKTNDFPHLYQVNSKEELVDIYNSYIDVDIYISEYILNNQSLSNNDGRVSSFRSYHILQSDLSIINLGAHQDFNSLSTENEFINDEILTDTKQLSKLHSAKYVPIDKVLPLYGALKMPVSSSIAIDGVFDSFSNPYELTNDTLTVTSVLHEDISSFDLEKTYSISVLESDEFLATDASIVKFSNDDDNISLVYESTLTSGSTTINTQLGLSSQIMTVSDDESTFKFDYLSEADTQKVLLLNTVTQNYDIFDITINEISTVKLNEVVVIDVNDSADTYFTTITNDENLNYLLPLHNTDVNETCGERCYNRSCSHEWIQNNSPFILGRCRGCRKQESGCPDCQGTGNNFSYCDGND